MAKPGQFQIGQVIEVEVRERRVVTNAYGRQFEQPVELMIAVNHEREEAFVMLNTGWNPEAQPGDTGTIILEAGADGPSWRYHPHTRGQAQEAKGRILMPGVDY